MTYAWPSASSIHRHQCLGETATGNRCRRARWMTCGEHHGHQGYLCHLHAHQDGTEAD